MIERMVELFNESVKTHYRCQREGLSILLLNTRKCPRRNWKSNGLHATDEADRSKLQDKLKYV